MCVRQVNRNGNGGVAIGRCPASAVPNHQGILILTDSIEKSTDNLTLHKRTSR
jgi:hypothetical protein